MADLCCIALKIQREVWIICERIVLERFPENDCLENFRMGKDTFTYICNHLCPHLKRKSNVIREPISVERRVAVTILHLATNVEYHSIGHLFGIPRASDCCIVQEICKENIHVLMLRYIK